MSVFRRAQHAWHLASRYAATNRSLRRQQQKELKDLFVEGEKVLFRSTQKNYFRWMGLASVAQMGLWVPLAYYTHDARKEKIRKAEEEGLDPDEVVEASAWTPAAYLALGFSFISLVFFYARNNVGAIKLVENGNALRTYSHAVLGRPRVRTIRIDELQVPRVQNASDRQITFKKKGDALYLVADERGIFEDRDQLLRILNRAAEKA